MAESDAVSGNPEQWQPFVERNAFFVERRQRIEEACNTILNRTLPGATLLDKAVFFAGHRIADDFMEVVVLAGNGEGRGAQKLLRPMFEQLVTMKYLVKYPDLIDQYMDYFHVDHRRLAKVIESTLGPDALGPKKLAEVEAEFQKVKSKYEVPDCKKCGTVRLAHAWTQVDLVTMAREVGVEAYLVEAYYLPLEQSHPKVGGMLSRIVETDRGIAPAPRLAPDLADDCLRAAHGLLILALGTQVDHFQLDAGPSIAKLDKDFGEIWRKAT